MNFDKNFHTYDECASVQKQVAINLDEFINCNLMDKNFDVAFEIGCGTGIFSSYLVNSLHPKELILNDFYDTKKYLKNIKYNKFLVGNIEEINIPKSNIIVSSSCLQWIKDFEELIKKISNSTKVFSFSIYTKGNLVEINKHFNISLDYLSHDEIISILKKYFKNVKSKKQSIIKNFDSPLKALKDLKNTGVTGFCKTSIHEIRSYKEKKLTYEISYFFCNN